MACAGSSYANNSINSNEHVSYKVKSGDQIGKVLHDLGFSPLWGSKGYVEKTVRLNAGRIKKSGNFVRSGVRIYFPAKKIISDSKPPKKLAKSKARPDRSLAAKAMVPHQNQDKDKDQDKELLFLSAALMGTYLRIDAKDKSNSSSATLGSKLSPGLRIGLDHRFSKTLSYGAFYRLQNLEFITPRNKTLSQEGRYLSDLGVATTYFGLSERAPVTFSLMFSERLFTAYRGATSVSLDKNFIPRTQVSVAPTVFETKTFRLGAQIGAGALLPAKNDSYFIYMGYNAFMGINAKHGLNEHLRLNTGILLDYSRQDSSQVEYKNLAMVFQVGLEFLIEPTEIR